MRIAFARRVLVGGARASHTDRSTCVQYDSSALRVAHGRCRDASINACVVCEPARVCSSLCGALDSHSRQWLLALCSWPRATAHVANAISTPCHVRLVRAFCAQLALLHAASVWRELIALRCARWMCAAADCCARDHHRTCAFTARQCQRRPGLFSKNIVLIRCVRVTLTIDTLSTSATSVLCKLRGSHTRTHGVARLSPSVARVQR